MFVVGLTGGIGAGKSTVADLFAKQGAHVIDTDVIARQLVLPGSKPLAAIVDHFSESVLDGDGALNRQRLAERIFNHPKDKIWLEQLLHPLIWQTVETRIISTDYDYHLVVVPLLLETKTQHTVDRILVVDSSPANQLTRAIQRGQQQEAVVKRIIQSQISRQERLNQADDIIYNDGELSELQKQVLGYHQIYMDKHFQQSAKKISKSTKENEASE